MKIVSLVQFPDAGHAATGFWRSINLSTSVRSIKNFLPSLIFVISLRRNKSRTAQTEHPKYAAACGILSNRCCGNSIGAGAASGKTVVFNFRRLTGKTHLPCSNFGGVLPSQAGTAKHFFTITGGFAAILVGLTWLHVHPRSQDKRGVNYQSTYLIPYQKCWENTRRSLN